MSPNDADGTATSVDHDQTAPLKAVWSGSAQFAQTYLSENLGKLRYSCLMFQYNAFFKRNKNKLQISHLMTKPTKWSVRPAKTQIRLGMLISLIRVFAVRSVGSWEPNVSSCRQRRLWSDQTGQMPRLIWTFAGRIDHFVGLIQDMASDPEHGIWFRTWCLIQNMVYGPEHGVWSRTRCLIQNMASDPEHGIWSRTWRLIKVCTVCFHRADPDQTPQNVASDQSTRFAHRNFC